ncbi:DndE family protein [Intestinibacillus massiliensis]|nr:DndE family protein [Intestinibacillus massiliensis]
MIFKLKLSQQTNNIFKALDHRMGLKPYTLVKHAIAWSVREAQPLSPQDFETDSLGMELNRQTITGNYDVYFKAVIEQYEQRKLSEDEYFPRYVKAHIDRGAQILNAMMNHAGSLERYILKSLGVGDTV